MKRPEQPHKQKQNNFQSVTNVMTLCIQRVLTTS